MLRKTASPPPPQSAGRERERGALEQGAAVGGGELEEAADVPGAQRVERGLGFDLVVGEGRREQAHRAEERRGGQRDGSGQERAGGQASHDTLRRARRGA